MTRDATLGRSDRSVYSAAWLFKPVRPFHQPRKPPSDTTGTPPTRDGGHQYPALDPYKPTIATWLRGRIRRVSPKSTETALPSPPISACLSLLSRTPLGTTMARPRRVPSGRGAKIRKKRRRLASAGSDLPLRPGADGSADPSQADEPSRDSPTGCQAEIPNFCVKVVERQASLPVTGSGLPT